LQKEEIARIIAIEMTKREETELRIIKAHHAAKAKAKEAKAAAIKEFATATDAAVTSKRKPAAAPAKPVRGVNQM